METISAPPRGLSKRSRAVWRDLSAAYAFEPHHFELLRSLCQTMDRLDQVRAAIAEQGLTVKGSTGQIRSNSLLGVERDLNTTLTRIIRALGVDLDQPGGRR